MTEVSGVWAKRRPLIIAMREAGRSVLQIAIHLGCTKGQVSGQIHNMKLRGIIPGGVKTAEEAGNQEIRWTDEMNAVMRRMRADRQSYEVIAEALGVSRSSAVKRGEALGLPMKLAPIKPALSVSESFWTEARRETVLKGVFGGSTYPEIARELGISRDAVARQVKRLTERGKIDRAFLDQRASKMRQQAIAKARASGASKPGKVKNASASVARVPIPSFSTIPEHSVDRVDFFDLEPGMCRWPFGSEAPFRFCGCRVSLGSYCAAHAAIAHPSGNVASSPDWARPRARA